MYSLNGYSNNVKNIYKLAAPFVGSSSIRSSRDLKASYIQFLNQHQPQIQVTNSADLIVRDQAQAVHLMEAFSSSKINDLSQEDMVGELYEDDVRRSCEELAQKALDELQKLNPEVHDLLNLAVHSILMCGSNLNASGLRAHGGTSSKCIGLMWLSMKGGLSVQDVMELFVHEMTHTLVFLDELSHPQFEYSELSHEKNWAQSSILARLRPMDKVVHSIVVAYEVLCARAHYLPNTDSLGVHPSSKRMKKNIEVAVRSVNNHPYRDLVCKPRALELINKVINQLDRI